MGSDVMDWALGDPLTVDRLASVLAWVRFDTWADLEAVPIADSA